MGLRTKILSGFLILTMMLVVAGVWSVYELTTVGTSVQRMLDDNYKSINAGRTMIEALEREDSAVLLLLSGNWEQGRSILGSADSLFQKGFTIAQQNVTIPGEPGFVDEIRSRYDVYRGSWKEPIVGTSKEGNLNWYFQQVHQAFLDVRLSVEELIALNDQTMYLTASDLKNKAHRAIVPGIVAILAALAFTIIFNFFINYYIVSPIIKTTAAIHKFVETGEPFNVQVETNDELFQLVSSIQRLVPQKRASEPPK